VGIIFGRVRVGIIFERGRVGIFFGDKLEGWLGENFSLKINAISIKTIIFAYLLPCNVK
jgi:hypothetical protein